MTSRTEQKVGQDHVLCYVETAFMVGSVMGWLMQGDDFDAVRLRKGIHDTAHDRNLSKSSEGCQYY